MQRAARTPATGHSGVWLARNGRMISPDTSVWRIHVTPPPPKRIRGSPVRLCRCRGVACPRPQQRPVRSRRRPRTGRRLPPPRRPSSRHRMADSRLPTRQARRLRLSAVTIVWLLPLLLCTSASTTARTRRCQLRARRRARGRRHGVAGRSGLRDRHGVLRQRSSHRHQPARGRGRVVVVHAGEIVRAPLRARRSAAGRGDLDRRRTRLGPARLRRRQATRRPGAGQRQANRRHAGVLGGLPRIGRRRRHRARPQHADRRHPEPAAVRGAVGSWRLGAGRRAAAHRGHQSGQQRRPAARRLRQRARRQHGGRRRGGP